MGVFVKIEPVFALLLRPHENQPVAAVNDSPSFAVNTLNPIWLCHDDDSGEVGGYFRHEGGCRRPTSLCKSRRRSITVARKCANESRKLLPSRYFFCNIN